MKTPIPLIALTAAVFFGSSDAEARDRHDSHRNSERSNGHEYDRREGLLTTRHGEDYVDRFSDEEVEHMEEEADEWIARQDEEQTEY